MRSESRTPQTAVLLWMVSQISSQAFSLLYCQPCGILPAQPRDERLARVGAAVAVLALHLADEVVGRPALRLRADLVVQFEEVGPVGLAGGPVADGFEVGGRVGERVRAPGEQEHVLGGAQLQHRSVSSSTRKTTRPRRGLLDLAAEVAGDLVGRDGLDAAVRHGVERRKRLVVGRPAGAGHGVARASGQQ